MTSSQAQSPGEPEPAVRIEGAATPEEVAAVIAVLAASGGASDEQPEGGSTWASHRTLLRGRHDPGPSAWSTTYRG
ncbi:acyl-CoA carboxylase epsilon subunit [Phycicoccus duodecadis]|uniref:Acyl-CoA carboxylase epsilon subunit-like protein n=1 Tax=Phycicoccus duodecadis TaxID=173053 RepID=A0A2N3YKA6_9MICO|nr:acyl-CoA carboxylase epsilon subunit [Phycicoccus duodecadis]PKW27249.1 acyl-CoA carboxylase epsilon subunit-like protein [Phycicoccus duodecadis]